ncbi:MAG: fatty acid desaturase [Candidatus Velthaea sp.]
MSEHVPPPTLVRALRRYASLRSVRRSAKRTFVLKLLVLGVLLACTFRLSVAPAPILQALSVVALGLLYAHAVELQHQCLHGTTFLKRRVNRLAGILLGVPMLVSFSDYRYRHQEHHRGLGTPKNREFFNYSYRSLHTIFEFLPHLFMVRHYRDVATSILAALVGTQNSEYPRQIRSDVRTEYLLLGGYCMLVCIFAATHPALALRYCILPLLVAIPTHALIELPEHWGCDPAGTPLRTTRTILAGPLAVWFTNANNYHVEHHLLGGLPVDVLPRVHRELGAGIVHTSRSYRAFYASVLRDLVAGKAASRYADRAAATR